jgi:hypothetical protein
MSHIDLGTTGAKRATWSENPRKLLKDIIDDNPNSSEAEWRRLFKAAARNEDDQIDAVLDYFLDNTIRSLMPRKAPERTAAAAARVKEARERAVYVKERVESRVREAAKIVLLELTMPNGKKLGECTGADCKRFDGWFHRLAKVVPVNKRVDETLSEKRLQQIWRQKK